MNLYMSPYPDGFSENLDATRLIERQRACDEVQRVVDGYVRSLRVVQGLAGAVLVLSLLRLWGAL